MERLEQIESIRLKLKIASRQAVYALYRLIFEKDGDRSSRKQLRQFPGFPFQADSAEYREKMTYAGQFSTGDLTAMCNVLGLDYQGTKEELRESILRSLIDIDVLVPRPHDDDDDDAAEDEVEVESDDENERMQRPRRQDDENEGMQRPRRQDDENEEIRRPRRQDDEVQVPPRVYENAEARNNVRFALSYKDVEDSIRTFDGSDNHSVERWITDFEEAAIMFDWNNIQMLIFAKRSLSGIAKMFVQSERGIFSWEKLKDALKSEFSTTLNSAELHRQLVQRKMQKGENLQEYYLAMKELAARGSIEDEALIQYTIDGIYDEARNKATLYGATTFKDFKERLKIYDRIRKASYVKRPTHEKYEATTTQRERPKTEASSSNTRVGISPKAVRCFNCGENGHRSSSCTKKSLGKKCFKCNRFGHEANNCYAQLKSVENKPINEVNTMTIDQSIKMIKKIRVENVHLDALIDTGSQLSLIREDVFCNLRVTKLFERKIKLTGFANGAMETEGYFQATTVIDGIKHDVTLHVVPRAAMNFDVIIGMDVLSRCETIINPDRVTIGKYDADAFFVNYNVTDKQNDELDIELTVSKEIRTKIETMVETYVPKKRKDANVELRVITKDDLPVFQRPRRLPLPEKEIVDRQIKEWIDHGIIEPCSSEYASPVVIVKKKDGTPRVCVDFRNLNKKIVKDRHPLPLLEDLIDGLKGACIFSTMDLRNGFFHVPVEESSRKFTSFVVHNGQFQFLKAPFGLCLSPAVFQRYINSIFRELIMTGYILVYLDDIIILASTLKEAIDRLKKVLEVASEYGLEINFKKCQFLKSRVEFLGHIIEDGNVYPSVDKTTAVMQFPEPRNVKEIQSFLGLTGYFRKFIANYAQIARPLSDLLKKEKIFQFTKPERHAFDDLKQILANDPVLKLYSPDRETELHTDASQDGYGAILLQRCPDDGQLHPIYYTSRKTNNAERNYKSYELEVLAIIGALKKFRIYLLGIKFKIVTDCAAFTQTMSKREVTPKIARWALILQEFDYTIEHRAGTAMRHVDALSRHSIMTIGENDLIVRIKEAQGYDDDFRVITELLKVKPYDDYCIRRGILYKFVNGVEVLAVPKDMQYEIINNIHKKGHFAAKKTEEIVKRDYFITNLKEKIDKVIANCISCILINRKAGKQEGYLHPIEKADVPLHTLHVDHLGPLESTSKKYNHILAVVDSFTKFIWLYPTKSTTSSETISKLNLQKNVFGNPVRFVTDRGTAFSSNEFKDYCDNEKIQHIMITTGLPRANGQVERFNRTIIPVLAKLSIDNPAKWYQHINQLQQTLNAAHNRSIGKTPFELLIGTKMRLKNDIVIRQLLEEALQADFENDREKMRGLAKEQIVKVQNENRKGYNLRRRDPIKYSTGELVAIKRTQLGPGRKLKGKFIGPYRIIKTKLNDTYDVEKVGTHEGPASTSTCAEYLKPWATYN